MRRSVPPIAAIAFLCLVLAGGAAAWAEDDNDHDLARDLYEHGEIKSLSEILTMVRGAVPGDVVAVDLVRVGGRWTYRFQVVDNAGSRRTVDVDAATAALEPALQSNP